MKCYKTNTISASVFFLSILEIFKFNWIRNPIGVQPCAKKPCSTDFDMMTVPNRSESVWKWQKWKFWPLSGHKCPIGTAKSSGNVRNLPSNRKKHWFQHSKGRDPTCRKTANIKMSASVWHTRHVCTFFGGAASSSSSPAISDCDSDLHVFTNGH